MTGVNQRSAEGLLYGCRSMMYLMLNFALGTAYFTALVTGFATGLSLSIVWIGIPILAFMFMFSRRLAIFDRWVAKSMLHVNAPPLDDDLRYRGHNILSYVGANFTSASTWQRIVNLFLKFPLGIVSVTLGWMLFPFFMMEAFINLIGLNTGMVSGHLMRALAAGLSGLNAGTLITTPASEREVVIPVRETEIGKRKRANTARERLVYVEEDYEPVGYDETYTYTDDEDEPVHQAQPIKGKRRRPLAVDDREDAQYYLDDDGEIRSRR